MPKRLHTFKNEQGLGRDSLFVEVQWQERKLKHQNKSFWAEASLEGGVEREGVVCSIRVWVWPGFPSSADW